MDTIVEQDVFNQLYQGRIIRTKDGELCALYQYCQNNIWQVILLNEDFTWKRTAHGKEPFKIHIEVSDIAEIVRGTIMGDM